MSWNEQDAHSLKESQCYRWYETYNARFVEIVANSSVEWTFARDFRVLLGQVREKENQHV